MKTKIELLLQNDLKYIAFKMGFIKQIPPYIKDNDAALLLNHAEYLSRRGKTDKELNKCLLICALIWERRNPSWSNLSSFLKQILIKIGLSPTALMIDDTNDNNNYFTSFGNLFVDLSNTQLIKNNRIEFNEKFIFLTKHQKEIWNSIFKYDRIGISAPTSAGKSFILCLSLINYLCDHEINAFYIVPNISLINQVSSDLRKIINYYNIGKKIRIHQSYSKVDNTGNIFILTQERAFSSLLQTENNIPKLDFLIVDEVQNIERMTFEDNDRADDLLTVLRLINDNINPKKIIISGPRIEKIDDLMKDLFNEKGFPINIKLSPVLNLTYSFKYYLNKYFLCQHSPINETPLYLELENNDLLNKKIFGAKQLTKPSIDILSYLSSMLQDDSILLFSSTKSQARKLAQSIKLKTNRNSELDSLLEYVSFMVHNKYTQLECIRNGVAYHNSNVPLNIRNVIEIAYKRKIIKLLTTTTTLLQGINLPAKYLIARNHRLNARGSDITLTPYEFANLRGRAGRLMQDFVGRAIIIDYKAFEDTQLNFYDYPSKEVSATYEHRFNSHKDEIIDVLINSKDLCSDFDYNDLIIFLRNRIYRYGKDSKFYTDKHNLGIDNATIEKVIKSFSNLTVPKKYCVLNPHWDIFVLQKIFDNQKKFKTFPKSPFSNTFKNVIEHNVKELIKIAPYYYEKYLNINLNVEPDCWEFDKLIKLALDWSQEKPLSNILATRMREVTEDKIEDHIELINQSVCYQLPKLLKPIIGLQDNENPLLSFMEYGAHTIGVKRMIEMGISREDAILIKKTFHDSFDDKNDEEIKKILFNNLKTLHVWTQNQIKEIIT